MRRFKINQNYRYSDCTFLLTYIGADGLFDYIGGGMKRDKENWIVSDC